MHVWYLQKWRKNSQLNSVIHSKGLRIRIDKEVDSTVHKFCIEFSKWLRKEFEFPLRVNVYIKKDYRIRAKDGDMVVGTFWRPENYNGCPYIRLATGDYLELVQDRGEEDAMWEILRTFAHELTHYFQYINNLKLTLRGEERQANAYADYVLDAYYSYIKDKMLCVEECKV